MDTYWIIDDGCDSIIVGAGEVSDALADMGSNVEMTRVELVRSYDHGLRAADETALVIASEIADWIVVPLMEMMMGRRGDRAMDSVHAILTEIGALEWDTTGWIDTGDSENDMDASQMLYELRDDVESAAWSAGYIVESSADAGMTWIYAKVGE